MVGRRVWVGGVDGCRAGWVVALWKKNAREPLIRVVAAIAEVDRWDERLAVLGVDIPIGLLDRAEPGGRECDREARRLLGPERSRSVFSPPARSTLRARTFDEAQAVNRRTAGGAPAPGAGISRQSFGILPKIREVDEWLSRRRRRRRPPWPDALEVVEVHPELSFYELNRGRPVDASKRSRDGLERRLGLLERAFRCDLRPLVEAHRSSTVARDDVVDALAVAWTARRVLARRAVRIPSHPPTDSRGLPMQIVR